MQDTLQWISRDKYEGTNQHKFPAAAEFDCTVTHHRAALESLEPEPHSVPTWIPAWALSHCHHRAPAWAGCHQVSPAGHSGLWKGFVTLGGSSRCADSSLAPPHPLHAHLCWWEQLHNPRGSSVPIPSCSHRDVQGDKHVTQNVKNHSKNCVEWDLGELSIKKKKVSINVLEMFAHDLWTLIMQIQCFIVPFLTIYYISHYYLGGKKPPCFSIFSFLSFSHHSSSFLFTMFMSVNRKMKVLKKPL